MASTRSFSDSSNLTASIQQNSTSGMGWCEPVLIIDVTDFNSTVNLSDINPGQQFKLRVVSNNVAGQLPTIKSGTTTITATSADFEYTGSGAGKMTFTARSKGDYKVYVSIYTELGGINNQIVTHLINMYDQMDNETTPAENTDQEPLTFTVKQRADTPDWSKAKITFYSDAACTNPVTDYSRSAYTAGNTTVYFKITTTTETGKTYYYGQNLYGGGETASNITGSFTVINSRGTSDMSGTGTTTLSFTKEGNVGRIGGLGTTTSRTLATDITGLSFNVTTGVWSAQLTWEDNEGWWTPWTDDAAISYANQADFMRNSVQYPTITYPSRTWVTTSNKQATYGVKLVYGGKTVNGSFTTTHTGDTRSTATATSESEGQNTSSVYSASSRFSFATSDTGNTAVVNWGNTMAAETVDTYYDASGNVYTGVKWRNRSLTDTPANGTYAGYSATTKQATGTVGRIKWTSPNGDEYYKKWSTTLSLAENAEANIEQDSKNVVTATVAAVGCYYNKDGGLETVSTTYPVHYKFSNTASGTTGNHTSVKTITNTADFTYLNSDSTTKTSTATWNANDNWESSVAFIKTAFTHDYKYTPNTDMSVTEGSYIRVTQKSGTVRCDVWAGTQDSKTDNRSTTVTMTVALPADARGTAYNTTKTATATQRGTANTAGNASTTVSTGRLTTNVSLTVYQKKFEDTFTYSIIAEPEKQNNLSLATLTFATAPTTSTTHYNTTYRTARFDLRQPGPLNENPVTYLYGQNGGYAGTCDANSKSTTQTAQYNVPYVKDLIQGTLAVNSPANFTTAGGTANVKAEGLTIYQGLSGKAASAREWTVQVTGTKANTMQGQIDASVYTKTVKMTQSGLTTAQVTKPTSSITFNFASADVTNAKRVHEHTYPVISTVTDRTSASGYSAGLSVTSKTYSPITDGYGAQSQTTVATVSENHSVCNTTVLNNNSSGAWADKDNDRAAATSWYKNVISAWSGDFLYSTYATNADKSTASPTANPTVTIARNVDNTSAREAKVTASVVLTNLCDEATHTAVISKFTQSAGTAYATALTPSYDYKISSTTHHTINASNGTVTWNSNRIAIDSISTDWDKHAIPVGSTMYPSTTTAADTSTITISTVSHREEDSVTASKTDTRTSSTITKTATAPADAWGNVTSTVTSTCKQYGDSIAFTWTPSFDTWKRTTYNATGTATDTDYTTWFAVENPTNTTSTSANATSVATVTFYGNVKRDGVVGNVTWSTNTLSYPTGNVSALGGSKTATTNTPTVSRQYTTTPIKNAARSGKIVVSAATAAGSTSNTDNFSQAASNGQTWTLTGTGTVTYSVSHASSSVDTAGKLTWKTNAIEITAATIDATSWAAAKAGDNKTFTTTVTSRRQEDSAAATSTASRSTTVTKSVKCTLDGTEFSTSTTASVTQNGDSISHSWAANTTTGITVGTPTAASSKITITNNSETDGVVGAWGWSGGSFSYPTNAGSSANTTNSPSVTNPSLTRNYTTNPVDTSSRSWTVTDTVTTALSTKTPSTSITQPGGTATRYTLTDSVSVSGYARNSGSGTVNTSTGVITWGSANVGANGYISGKVSVSAGQDFAYSSSATTKTMTASGLSQVAPTNPGARSTSVKITWTGTATSGSLTKTADASGTQNSSAGSAAPAIVYSWATSNSAFSLSATTGTSVTVTVPAGNARGAQSNSWGSVTGSLAYGTDKSSAAGNQAPTTNTLSQTGTWTKPAGSQKSTTITVSGNGTSATANITRAGQSADSGNLTATWTYTENQSYTSMSGSTIVWTENTSGRRSTTVTATPSSGSAAKTATAYQDAGMKTVSWSVSQQTDFQGYMGVNAPRYSSAGAVSFTNLKLDIEWKDAAGTWHNAGTVSCSVSGTSTGFTWEYNGETDTLCLEGSSITYLTTLISGSGNITVGPDAQSYRISENTNAKATQCNNYYLFSAQRSTWDVQPYGVVKMTIDGSNYTCTIGY